MSLRFLSRAGFAGAVGALLFAGQAAAQSAPGLYNGMVPTAQQWNSYFQAKQDYYPGAVTIVGPGASTPGDMVCWNGTYPQVYDCGAVHIPRGHIDGLNMQAAGGSASLTIGAGEAADSTGTFLETLGSSLVKTTAAWTQGSSNGCLDTGTIANATWYHVYLIEKADRSASDVVCSLSSLSPSLPSGWTYFRRIGSVLTDGSAHWTAFVQKGDEFLWSTPVNDINTTSLGTTATAFALSVAPGVNVKAHLRGYIVATTPGSAVVITSPLAGAPILATPIGEITAVVPAANVDSAFTIDVMTDGARNVKAVANVSALTVEADTYGWTDFRGRNN